MPKAPSALKTEKKETAKRPAKKGVLTVIMGCLGCISTSNHWFFRYSCENLHYRLRRKEGQEASYTVSHYTHTIPHYCVLSARFPINFLVVDCGRLLIVSFVLVDTWLS